MEIKRFVCNMIRENTYVVSDDTREAVIIDCGAYYEEERKAIKQYIDDGNAGGGEPEEKRDGRT